MGGDPPGDASGRRVSDPDGPRCALRGVTSALESAREERVLIVATDLPLVTPDLLLALVAWPVAYGDSGVMTFVVNHKGQIYEKNLGPNTDSAARGMQAFDPDSSWRKVSP